MGRLGPDEAFSKLSSSLMFDESRECPQLERDENDLPALPPAFESLWVTE
jgi:hypothetical protein